MRPVLCDVQGHNTSQQSTVKFCHSLLSPLVLPAPILSLLHGRGSVAAVLRFERLLEPVYVLQHLREVLSSPLPVPHSQ